jgi:hypothetical protein
MKEHKVVLMAMLTWLAVLGFSGVVLGCADLMPLMPPPRISDTQTGLLTITDIPSQYNGQYAVVSNGYIQGAAMGYFGGNAYLRGANQSPSEISTDPIFGIKIANGTVTIPVYAALRNRDTRDKWHGFADSKIAKYVQITITEQDSVPQKVVTSSTRRAPSYFVYEDIAFTDGSATVSFSPSLPPDIEPLGKESELRGTWRGSEQRSLTFYNDASVASLGISDGTLYNYWYTYDGADLILYRSVYTKLEAGKGSAEVKGTTLTLNTFENTKAGALTDFIDKELLFGDHFNGTWTKAK